MSNILEEVDVFYSTVEGMLHTKKRDVLTSNDVEREVRSWAPRFGFNDEEFIKSSIRIIETRVATDMGEGVSLVDVDNQHDDRWHAKKDIDWHYWNDYKHYLQCNRYPHKVIHSLEGVTEKILGLLNDPEKQECGQDGRKGLVIGHVQSGKTANYLGVISRAADAGYKLIIVLAGIHENLRKQTQQRIDEGFVGVDSNPENNRAKIGVGVLNRKHAYPLSLTNTQQDFNKQIADSFFAEITGFNRPLVLVLKKNVHTLARVHSWLKTCNTQHESQKILDVPMLMIDDEADNASINTNKPEIDPTRTNREIRQILKLFHKKCYVGYTATPFANIFINPDSESEMLEDDLFPRDFIYSLDASTNYWGADKLFLDDVTRKNIVRAIDDAEDYIPIAHKTKNTEVLDIPPSLREAIRVFILSKAIRLVRGQSQKHSSMMVNVSRFVDVQRQVKDYISLYLEEISKSVRFNHALPPEDCLKNSIMKSLKSSFDHEFPSVPENWDDVVVHLPDAIECINTFLINSKSDETLDYKRAEDSGESLTVIAVGGLTLSRGLTLEGLSMSYMYRNTKMYDTLLQMGRWFGYREGYDDLCRIYLSDESSGWYQHIAEAIEELNDNIKQMRRDGIKPKDFGLYVRAHPDALAVTALNKMRDTETRALRVNYSGRLVETHILSVDQKAVEHNRSVVRGLYKDLNSSQDISFMNYSGSIFASKVDWETVHNFLYSFKFHGNLRVEHKAVSDYLKKVSEKYPQVDIAFVSLKNDSGQARLELGEKPKEFILSQERQVGTQLVNGVRKYEYKKPNIEDGYYIGLKQRVASREAENVGLPAELIEAKKKEKELDGLKNIPDIFYRDLRARPLLMVHSLTLVDKGRVENEKTVLAENVPAISISFPSGDIYSSVEYVVNRVWLDQFYGDLIDTPDQEDGYGI